MLFFRSRAQKAKDSVERLLRPDSFAEDWKKVLAENKDYLEESLIRRIVDEGIVSARHGRTVEAIRILRIGAQASMYGKDLALRGLAHRWLAVALIHRMPSIPGEKGVTLRDAVAALDVAASCYQAVGKSRVLAQLWRDKAMALREAGLNEEAAEAYGEALKLIDRNGLPNDEPGLMTQCMNGRAECLATQRKTIEQSEVLRRDASRMRREGKLTAAVEIELKRARARKEEGRFDEARELLEQCRGRLEGVAREVKIEALGELAELLLEMADRSPQDRLVLKAEAAQILHEMTQLAPEDPREDQLTAEAMKSYEALLAIDREIALDPVRIRTLLREGPDLDQEVAVAIEELEAKMTRQSPTVESVVLDAPRAAQVILHGWSRLEAMGVAGGDSPNRAIDVARMFIEAVMLDPTKPEAWAGYAEAVMQASTRDGRTFAPRGLLRALPHAMLAVKLGPWSRAARYALGLAYLRLGMQEEAALQLAELEKVASRSHMALELRIALAEAKGNREEAMRQRELMLGVAPTPAIRRRHLNRLVEDLIATGDLRRAEQAVRGLVEGFADFAPGWLTYARLLQKQGKTHEALAASNKAIALGNLPEAVALSEELLKAVVE